jgi:hypothetical protein
LRVLGVLDLDFGAIENDLTRALFISAAQDFHER